MKEREDGWLVLEGPLTMETVPALFDVGLQRLARGDLRVDFSGVKSADSAAVSMLLGWGRAAERSGHALHVTALPDVLLSLARLYGVADLLPQQ